MLGVEWAMPPETFVRSSRCVARRFGGSKVVWSCCSGWLRVAPTIQEVGRGRRRSAPRSAVVRLVPRRTEPPERIRCVSISRMETTVQASSSVYVVDASTVSHPPEITMNLPSSASCPGHVTLDAMISDPENDVESIRWRVNEHLMAPSVERVDIEASGTVFEVVACDSRGGCVREEATVDCLPYCDGEAVPCTQYTGGNPSLCESQPGCSVTSYYPPYLHICGGSRSCDSFGETDCTVAHGCTWLTP
jgi:hypothetical protein